MLYVNDGIGDADGNIGTIQRMNVAVEDVVEIQADGDELQLIINTFTVNDEVTIPITNKRVQNWYGDIAKGIWKAINSY